MEQLNLDLDFGGMFESVTSVSQLRLAFSKVKSNGGAPGVDGVTIDTFEADLDHNLCVLSQELRNWRYEPGPVKRVRIPKAGTTKKRLIGIPTVFA